jgi:hypothetical protein
MVPWILEAMCFIVALVTSSTLLLVVLLQAPVVVGAVAGALGVLAGFAYLRRACELYKRGEGPRLLLVYDEESTAEGA